MRYLPDWLYGFAPPAWWPARARDAFWQTLNVLPIVAGGAGGGQILNQQVVFSKAADTLVFGALGLVTTTDGALVVNMFGGTGTALFVDLSNSASGENYTSDSVPFESLFGTFFALTANAGLPCVWPMPLACPRGAALQVALQSFLNIDVHVRLSFLTARIDTRARKVA